MMRTCLAAALVALALSVLMQGARDRTRQAHQDIVRLENLMARERETIRILEAEWSYLNRPERLHDLATRHAALAPITARQIGSFRDIPYRDGPHREVTP